VNAARALFWASGAATAWVLVGYPAALALLPRRPWRPGEDLPRVSVVIAAYREREELAAKLRSLDAQDYPAERLQLVVVVDEDRETAELARAARPDALVLFAEERGGKPAALNRGIAAADGDVVLMTDANNLLEPGSLRAALRHFADPSIAAVAGRRGEERSAYDRYESMIRTLETRTGSVAAMSGELMAVRRELLDRPFPEDAVVDDLWLLCNLARQGGRAVYEPGAGSTEPAIGHRAEVARRSRMGAGRLQMASELRGLPWGFRWRVLSHKYGRLALPVLLPLVLLSSLALARRQPYRAAAAVQLAAYGAGLASIAGVEAPGPAGKLARACGQFLLGNYSVGVGLVRGLRKAQGIRWDPVR
jgi:cellulose synthase/poly-beta-1,6-N-acetylglucosamine synthase-like glycosyltransferase